MSKIGSLQNNNKIDDLEKNSKRFIKGYNTRPILSQDEVIFQVLLYCPSTNEKTKS